MEYNKDHKSTNINWEVLCNNPKAIKILEKEYKKNPDSTKIKWNILSGNTNPVAIKLLDMKDTRDSRKGKGTHYLKWDLISSNTNAINMIIRRLKLEKKRKKFPNSSSYSRLHLNPKRIYIGDIKWKILLQNPSIFTT